MEKNRMPTLEDLAERVERLLLRHTEMQRTHRLLEQELVSLGHERDSLRSRLNAARSRIDALLDRLPVETSAASGDKADESGAGADGTAKS